MTTNRQAGDADRRMQNTLIKIVAGIILGLGIMAWIAQCDDESTTNPEPTSTQDAGFVRLDVVAVLAFLVILSVVVGSAAGWIPWS